MKYKNVIVKKPAPSMTKGITTSDLGKPDYEKALKQHQNYINALKKCGVEVTVLDADNDFPDSTFVEDPAIVTEKAAIITNPGAESRKGETRKIKGVIEEFFTNIHTINMMKFLKKIYLIMLNYLYPFK